jgi:hypothetical protein
LSELIILSILNWPSFRQKDILLIERATYSL